MRGGTANCTSIISSDLIGSPVVDNPSALIAMNGPSLDKFGPRVEKGGLIVLNSSLIEPTNGRDGITLAAIPLNEIAGEIGSQKVINMVALGAWARFTDALTLEDVVNGMEAMLSDMGKGNFIDVNRTALEKGYEYFN